MDYSTAGDVLEDLINDFAVLDSPNIRPINSILELREVYKLTHDSYVSAGYSEAHPSKMLAHYPYFDHIPETTILAAVLNGKIVGSVSLTLDGPCGFTVDEDFKEECDAIRLEGKPMATVWRLVVDDALRTKRSVVMNLISDIVFRLGRNHIPTALFAVNPKHEKVYKHMLNMEAVARKMDTGGLRNAPAILLRGDPDKIPQRGPRLQVPAFNPIHALITSGAY